MSNQLPLLGAPGVLDLKARAENKKLREIAAQGLEKNRALVAQIELLGGALHEAVELLKEARDFIRGDLTDGEGAAVAAKGAALAARISERVGD